MLVLKIFDSKESGILWFTFHLLREIRSQRHRELENKNKEVMYAWAHRSHAVLIIQML